MIINDNNLPTKINDFKEKLSNLDYKPNLSSDSKEESIDISEDTNEGNGSNC